MNFRGLVITGTEGSGKSSIVTELLKINSQLLQVTAVTTRRRRPDDIAGQYDYVSDAVFDIELAKNTFAVESEYRGFRYAIRNRDILVIQEMGRTPVLVVTPEAVNRYFRLHQSKDAVQLASDYLTVFVDAPDTMLDARLFGRGLADRTDVVLRRETDRKYKDGCIYTFDNLDLAISTELVRSLWDNSSCGGVLPARLIRLMLRCGLLLRDYNLDRVSGASYDLSLGDEFFYHGQIHHLTDRTPFLTMGGFQKC